MQNYLEKSTIKDSTVIQGNQNTVINTPNYNVFNIIQGHLAQSPAATLRSRNKLTIPRNVLQFLRCNRKTQVNQFSSYLRALPHDLGHFVFSYGSGKQHPHSLAERLIFEMESEHRVFKKMHDDRVMFFDLPVGNDLEDSIFKTYESIIDILGVNEFTGIENLADENSYLKEYDYVVLPFTFRSSDWNPLYYKYLQWLINEFSVASKKVTFIFFIAIFVDDAKPAGTIAFEKLKRFLPDFGALSKLKKIDRHCENVLVMNELEQVRIGDLKEWFRTFIKNENVIDDVLKSFYENNDRFPEIKRGVSIDDFSKLNMSSVEELMESVVMDNRTNY